jgi:hypothetical protein
VFFFVTFTVEGFLVLGAATGLLFAFEGFEVTGTRVGFRLGFGR